MNLLLGLRSIRAKLILCLVLLFAAILESQDGIEVVGTASDPFKARALIKELNPDVVTLDVEMPGMNGIEFLEKIMRLRPMPVVMVSTLTQKGTAASIEALRLGAVDCFPKPTSGTAEALRELAPQLAGIVRNAARSRVRPPAQAARVACSGGFDWNGKVVAMECRAPPTRREPSACSFRWTGSRRRS